MPSSVLKQDSSDMGMQLANHPALGLGCIVLPSMLKNKEEISSVWVLSNQYRSSYELAIGSVWYSVSYHSWMYWNRQKEREEAREGERGRGRGREEGGERGWGYLSRHGEASRAVDPAMEIEGEGGSLSHCREAWDLTIGTEMLESEGETHLWLVLWGWRASKLSNRVRENQMEA